MSPPRNLLLFAYFQSASNCMMAIAINQFQEKSLNMLSMYYIGMVFFSTVHPCQIYIYISLPIDQLIIYPTMLIYIYISSILFLSLVQLDQLEQKEELVNLPPKPADDLLDDDLMNQYVSLAKDDGQTRIQVFISFVLFPLSVSPFHPSIYLFLN